MDIQLLLPYARDHHGVVTLRHVLQNKLVTRAAWYRAIHAGLLEPLHPGVARVVGAAETREQRIMAAVLAVPAALASHRSAAFLWGIPRPDNDPVDVIVSRRTREATLAGCTLHRPRDHADLKRVLRSRIRTTNILRTLCDLGAVDAATVPGAVGHALSTGLAEFGAIERAVIRHSEHGRHGIVALRDALQAWQLDDKPADSVLEPAMHRLLGDFGLPPAAFHEVIEGHEVDFRIIDTPIVIECDGWTTHGLVRKNFERDRDRDARLVAAGYVVIRLTYRQITQRRAETARKIEQVVRRWAPDALPHAS